MSKCFEQHQYNVSESQKCNARADRSPLAVTLQAADLGETVTLDATPSEAGMAVAG